MDNSTVFDSVAGLHSSELIFRSNKDRNSRQQYSTHRSKGPTEKLNCEMVSGSAATVDAAGKGRRSFFSALFHSALPNSNTSQQQQQQQQQDAGDSISLKARSIECRPGANSHQSATGERRRSSVSNSGTCQPGRNRAARLVAENDIVIVPPSEARCVEAQIRGAATDDRGSRWRRSSLSLATRESLASDQPPPSQARASDPSVMRRLFSKMTRKSAPVTKGASEESSGSSASPRSYVNELNERLELERRRFHLHREQRLKRNSVPANFQLPERRSSSLCSSSGSSRESPARAWHANENYIPKMGGIHEEPSQPSAAAASEKQQQQRRRAGPLLEQFLESHRIRFDSLSSLVTDSSATSSSGDVSSSCNSLSCQLRRQSQASAEARAQPGRPDGKALDALEPDQRLMHWQSLAARSSGRPGSGCGPSRAPVLRERSALALASIIAHSEQDSDSDDDDLELLQCLTNPEATLVCSCSDDTSCSSLELVWSRPQLIERRRAYRQQQQLQRNLDSTRVKPVKLVAGAFETPPSPLSSTGGPASVQSASISPRPLSYRQQRVSPAARPARQQHATVFELAKPYRARDRRVADENDMSDYVRLRSREQRRERRQGKQTTETRDEASEQEGARAALTPVSRSSSGQSQWVKNPLFPEPEASHEPAQRRASCVDLISATRPDANSPLQLESERTESQKIDLTAKLNHCKELLRRLGGTSDHDHHAASDQSGGAEATRDHLREHGPMERSLRETSDHELDGKQQEEQVSAFVGAKDKHHRWSLRVGGPFRSTNGNVVNLNRLINLDRKIKSNVSSITSQLGEKLSDTGKRASSLADQLITSIRDTTKEQIVPLATGLHPRDTLPNTFATTSSSPALLLGALGSGGQQASMDPLGAELQSKLDPNNNKAKMFSLIYMHQLQSSGGHPVITSQPRSLGGHSINVQTTKSTRTITPPSRERRSSLIVGSKSREIPPRHIEHCNTIAAGQPGRELDSRRDPDAKPIRPPRPLKRRLRMRRRREQAAAASKANFSSDEDDDAMVGALNGARTISNFYRGVKEGDLRQSVTY